MSSPCVKKGRQCEACLTEGLEASTAVKTLKIPFQIARKNNHLESEQKNEIQLPCARRDGHG